MDRGAWCVIVHGLAKEPDVTYHLNNIHTTTYKMDN